MKLSPTLLISLAIVLCGLSFLYFSHKKDSTPSLESISTSQVPWPAELQHLKARLLAIHLPALTTEGQALHIHQHLDLFVHGTQVAVPAGIGIKEGMGGFIAPIHVHDTTGIVHVESPTVESYTLGQFFDIWGVRFSATCLGGYCSDTSNSLTMYVNGRKFEGDPRTLQLAGHQEIVIVFGTVSEVPKVIPSSYMFPEGY